MKVFIENLKGENFKRLVKIEIQPKTNVIEITGKNAQGKTSVLDLVWWLLNNPGRKEFPDPVRLGEEKAFGEIKLTNGIVVERTKTEGKDTIKVGQKQNGKWLSTMASPVEVLGKMVGTNCDPLEFIRSDPKAQVELLLDAIGKREEMDQLDEQYRAVYDDRRDQNVRLRDLEGRIKSVPEEAEKVDLTVLMEEMRLYREQRLAKDTVEDTVARDTNILTDTQQEINTLQGRVEMLEGKVQTLRENIESQKTALTKMPYPNLDEAKQKLEDMGTINEKAAKWDEYQFDVGRVEGAREQVEQLSTKLKTIDKSKIELLETARLPIKGLKIADGKLQLNGVPLKQISDSEQVKIAVAIAAKSIPDNGVRAVLIKRANDLDNANRTLIAEMAEKMKFQAWLEYVDDSDEVGIVMENGRIKKNNYDLP